MKMRTLIYAAALIAAPTFALAVGSDSDTPPTPTDTTKTCTDGKVWDPATKACINPGDSSLNDADRLNAVRELAYAGRLTDAERVLDAMSDQMADGVLTYRGFTARKAGRMDEAFDWYAKALAANPDNLLARSYLGQAHVAEGNLVLARAELTEIRKRGGRSTWAELSLRRAIETGKGYSY